MVEHFWKIDQAIHIHPHPDPLPKRERGFFVPSPFGEREFFLPLEGEVVFRIIIAKTSAKLIYQSE